MCKYKSLFGLCLLISSIGLSSCVRIVQLSVPPIADLQEEEISLDCNYDMGGEELNSVKWYKDEEEFFRYIPRGGGTLVFPVVGAHALETADCNNVHCSVTLTQLSKLSTGAYRCEVSTEAPTFRVAFETANMTIVAFPRGAVNINTPRREYSEGEEIRVNCTAPPSDPPSQVRWMINDRQLSPSAIIAETDSVANDLGLISRSVSARIFASRELFMRHTGLLELRCEVTGPSVPHVSQTQLHATVYMSLLELRGQKFDWLSSSGSSRVNFAHFQISFCTAILFIYTFIW